MPPDLTHLALEVLSGAVVGFTLGLIGGGGSILAVPLMVYVVGVANPHVAIGTSALAVAVNALAGLAQHARAGTVKWRCAAIFATCGVVGAFGGATLGKAMDGRRLLLCFALLMIVVGVLMVRGRRNQGCAGAACNRENVGRVMTYGLGTGALSGFFGIGGGFLIVPALIASTGMPILNAIGTSLVAVAAFGASTALS
ncbi:MAG: sulfite exporter TauE/SafE family protein, partial [Pseudoclavibacter sp.]